MAIERVNSVYDIPALKKEFADFVAGLSDSQKAIMQLYQTIQSYRNTSLATIGKDTEKLAAATDKVVAVTAKMNDTYVKAERAKQAVLKTDQQVLKSMQEEEKVAQQAAKTKQANIRLDEQIARQKERVAKQLEKERQQLEKTSNAYEQLKAEYTAAANESKRLAAEMMRVAGGNKQVFDSISKNNRAYQDATKNAQRLYVQLDELETAVGQYQRRVGQYERSNTALAFSFQQLTREGPAFANSLQTGLMGLSNNIPIFVDEIQRAKREGQSFGQILKTIASSLFSFGGIVSILTTVLTFLPSILNAMSTESREAARAIDETAKATGLSTETIEKYKEELSNTTQEAAQTSGKLQYLIDRVKSGGLSFKEKERILKTYNDEFGDTVGLAKDYNQLESILIEKAPIYIRMLQLKAQAAAYTNVLTEKTQELIKKQLELGDREIEIPSVTLGRDSVVSDRDLQKVYDYYGQTRLAAKANSDFQQSTKPLRDEITLLAGKIFELNAEIESVNVQYDFNTDKVKKNTKEKKDAIDTISNLQRAEFDLQKFRIETQMQFNQSVADNETLNYDVRMAAAARLAELQQQLAELTADFNIKEARRETAERLKEAGLTAAQRKNIENTLKTELQLIEETKQKEIGDINAEAAERIYNIWKANQDQIVNDLSIVPDVGADADQAVRDYEKMMGAMLNIAKKRYKDIEDARQKDFNDLRTKAEAASRITNNLFAALGEGQSIGIETAIVRVQELEAEQQKAYEREVQRIANSTLSEQEKADKLKILEAQRQAQKEANDRRQRQLEVERARFERAQNVANIIGGTAVAVINALGAKPWTPLNIALAASVGALGAVQLAKALAVPLPKFEKGTDSAPGGWAITDEKGPEMYIEPGGNTFMGSDRGPVMRYLKPGTKIIPADEVNERVNAAIMAETVRRMNWISQQEQKKKEDHLGDRLDQSIALQAMMLKELRKRRGTTINNNIDLGWAQYVKSKTFN